MNWEGSVAAGVDTHKDAHALCVVDRIGRVASSGTFPATSKGYDQLAKAIGPASDCIVVGIEGTGSYGAGLCRRLQQLGYHVVEVVRPKRKKRRLGTSKNDHADAERAARDALSGEASGAPRSGTGWVEEVRAHMVARESCVRASTDAMNTAKSLIVTAPSSMREALSGLKGPKMMEQVAGRHRSGDGVKQAMWDALRTLSASWRQAKDRAAFHEERIRALIRANAPALLDMSCCGPISAGKLVLAAGDKPERMLSEAAFASLCGASPVEASSGKVVRHRLNRGGNRQANRALHTIVRLRMSKDAKTVRYVERRTAEGKSRREIERCLVRYVSRQAFHALTHPLDTDWLGYSEFGAELKRRRLAAGVSQ